MARPSALSGPAIEARASLPDADSAAFDRLAHAVLASLTPAQWRSLYECWCTASRAPGPGTPGGRRGGRPSTHGHAPGAAAIPRWGQ